MSVEVTVAARAAGPWQRKVNEGPYVWEGPACCNSWPPLQPDLQPYSPCSLYSSHLPSLTCHQALPGCVLSTSEPALCSDLCIRALSLHSDVTSKFSAQEVFSAHLMLTGPSPLPPSNPLLLCVVFLPLIVTGTAVCLFVYLLSMSASVSSSAKCRLWGLDLLPYFWFAMLQPEPGPLRGCNTHLLNKWMRTALPALKFSEGNPDRCRHTLRVLGIYSRERVWKLWSAGLIHPSTCFYTKQFIGTRPCSFLSIFSMAACTLRQQSWRYDGQRLCCFPDQRPLSCQCF